MRSSESGIRIGDETLRQFKAGETSDAWLIAVLGPPTSISEVAGIPGTYVYRYATGEDQKGLASVLVGGGSRNTAVTYFILTDGIVTRFWSDRAMQTTILGKQVHEPAGEKMEESQ